jgi:APA family basic amino acid/polyamine antiporter
MALGVLRRKNLDAILKDAEAPEMTLHRTLGASDIILLGIGAIIGAGIFSTVGTAAAGDPSRPGAGAALMVSFIITAIVCGFTALCYAEFASMVPISGSAYTYSYATLGELVAWIIGWDLIIEYAVGNVSVAISWAAYFRTLLEGFGITIPDWAAMEYRAYAAKVAEGSQTWDAAPSILGLPFVFNFLAAGIVAAITILLVWGVRESARFNSIMVIIKLIVLAFFVGAGFFYVRGENYTPFAPNGFHGISTAAAIVFFAYIGFDAVSTVAEETREPQRNMPIGIIGSLVVCTIIYIVVAAIFTGLIPYSALQETSIADQAEPLTYALQYAAGQTGANNAWINSVSIGGKSFIDIASFIVAIGAVIATTAVLLVFQLGQPRIFFSMARDGLLPQVFAKIHPKFRTPHVTTILTGVVVGLFAGVASIDEMVDLTNIGTLFAFILVCAGVIVLRIKDPDRPRPFRAPGGLIIPILGIVSCLYLMYFLPSTSWFRFAAWLNFGFVIYIAYGAVKSRLTGRDTVEDKTAHEADTAWAGASLGAAGLALLFGAMALDIWARAGKPLEEGGQAESFLNPSWFLVIPLLLNVVVLFPVTMLRAKRVLSAVSSGPMRSRAVGAIAISAVLLLLSIAYLVAVLPNKLG